MSQETFSWLNRNVLVGFTDKRGDAWHYRASDQGDEPNHYTGAIPVADVERRLFHWTPVEGTVETTITVDADDPGAHDRAGRRDAPLRAAHRRPDA